MDVREYHPMAFSDMDMVSGSGQAVPEQDKLGSDLN